MPDRPVRIACQGAGERGVRQPALLAGYRLIDSRPDQWVPEPESALIERSQTGRGGHRPVVDVVPCSEELFGRAIQLGEVAVLECRKQHQRSNVGVESGQPRRKRRLEPSRQGERLPCPGQLEIGRYWELDQGERIAGRLRDDPPFEVIGQARRVPVEEHARRVVVQTDKVEVGEAGIVENTWHTIANREEQDHRLHLEPPRNERQHLGRRPIEPMRILDHEQQRCLRLPLGDHAEGCQADQEEIGRVALGDPERDVEGLALWTRTVTHPVEEWKQQLMEPSEGQPRLRLRARRRHHHRAVLARPLPGSLEQRRLADSRLATDNEGATMPGKPIDHCEEALQFLIAPYQQPPGAPSRPRISTGDTHAYPPLGDDGRNPSAHRH